MAEMSGGQSAENDAATPPRYRCPVHDIPDCSALLNGCNIPNLLRTAWNDGYAAGCPAPPAKPATEEAR